MSIVSQIIIFMIIVSHIIISMNTVSHIMTSIRPRRVWKVRPTLQFLIVVGGKDFLPPLQQLPPLPHQCGGLGRRKVRWKK